MLIFLLPACQQAEQVADLAAPSPTAQGFHLTPLADGWDVDLIRFYLPEPDTLHLEFRQNPGPNQLSWPVERVLTLSATQVGMIALAERQDAIVAVDDKQYVYDSLLRERIDLGEVAEVGYVGQLDMETIVALRPELVLTSGFSDGSNQDLLRLEALGIPLLPIAEWQETHPLARADWARVVGAVLGESAVVDPALAQIHARYDSLVALLHGVDVRPLVLTGSPFQGVWSSPAGESFLANLVKDAGGKTAWESQPGTASLALDPEVVYLEGLRADVWINPGTVKTIAELTGAMPRYAVFPAVKAGNVYNCYRLAREDGANAYWESGAVRPDLVLQDFMAIFHPDLFSHFSMTYYEPLTP
ncbi:MAG: ABC transporter substrate-binding protein [Bacteroidia bacterium]|nr:ABC transporter substrate-binding protein [Bacteroidia bacterium]